MALWLAASAGGLAEPKPGPRPDMGRIAHSGFKTFAHCTATLIEGGHVLTAAHCLPKIISDPIHLGLGYDRGAHATLISALGTDYRVLPARDVAVYCAAAQPEGLAVASGAEPPSQVAIWGYGRPFVHILNRKTCAVTRTTPRSLVLGCAATPGYSGGAVTAGEPPVLVGIVSRASRTRTVVERFDRSQIAELCE